MKRGSIATLAHELESIEIPNRKDGTLSIYRRLYVIDGRNGLFRRMRPSDDQTLDVTVAWFAGGEIDMVHADQVENELKEAGVTTAHNGEKAFV